MQTLNKMKEKLEKETNEHKLVKQQVTDLSTRLHDLSTVGHTPTILSSWNKEPMTLELRGYTLSLISVHALNNRTKQYNDRPLTSETKNNHSHGRHFE